MTRIFVFILFLALHRIYAQEQCTTPNNKAGTCVNIRNCQALINILRQPRPLPQNILNFLKNSQCGFEGNDPKVCCETQVSQSLPVDESAVISDPPNVQDHPNLSLLDWNICGPVSRGRIIGGNKTGIFDFPWMALIGYNTGKPEPEFRCGGSIITKRYVLTAAHCITQLPPGLTLLGVRIGEHNLATERDCEKGESELELVCAERYQDFPVESVHYHPSYTRSKLQNDVGLIRMNADADFRPASVKPICLPARPTLRSLSPTQKVVVTGWGSTETGRQSDDLLQIQLSQISTEACKDIYKAHAPIWHKQICAGGNRSVDSCPGDSGGPLQVPVPYNRNLRYVQYGIVSFGLRNCGTEGFPGVYTNVVYYMDWILDTIRD